MATSRVRSVANKLIKWFLFTVCLAIAPLAITWLMQVTDGEWLPLREMVSKGELLLISAPLCAAAMADLIGSGKKMLVGKIVCGGCSVITLFICSCYYSFVFLGGYAGHTIDVSIVAKVSQDIFIFAFITNAATIVLAEVAP